jgi:hypothetical protein
MRDVNYRPSAESTKKLLKNPCLNFLTHCFITSELGKNFIEERLRRGRNSRINKLKFNEIFGDETRHKKGAIPVLKERCENAFETMAESNSSSEISILSELLNKD